LREPARAHDLLLRAIECAPTSADAHNALGTARYELGEFEAAAASFERALALDPQLADAYYNLGNALQMRGRLEEADLGYDEALRRKPDFNEAQLNKSLVLLALGRYPDGWALYESRLRGADQPGVPVIRSRRWDGRAFPERSLLIHSEQGLGDALQFVRFAAWCKTRGGTVTVQCQRPLLRLLRTCPGVDAVLDQAGERSFDFEIEMMSLPYLFGLSLETIPAKIPYLSASDEARARWRGRVAGDERLQVGLVWAGAPREFRPADYLIDRRRSMGLARMRPLLNLACVRFHSLQLGQAARQIDELDLRGILLDHSADIGDYMDTTAIIEQLDLVIAVDTSVVHAAGALGRPVWVLSRFDACWRWLRNRETNPWYPTARVFGQPAPGDWDTVIANAAEALARVAAAKRGAGT
jgi:hypothetical protein